MMTNYKESLLAFTFLLIVHNSDKGFMGRGFVLLITVGSNIWKLLNIRLWKLLVTCGFWFNSPWLLSRWISNVFLRCFSTVLMFQYIIIHCLQNIKVLSVKECIPQSPGIQWWYDSGYRERHHSCELGLWFQWSFFFSFLTVFFPRVHCPLSEPIEEGSASVVPWVNQCIWQKNFSTTLFVNIQLL